MTKTTAELSQGDRVRLTKTVTRTVASVEPTTYVNRRNEVIYRVNYTEGRTFPWGEANTALATTIWEVQ